MMKTIEINLLPRREEGSKKLFYVSLVIVFLCILGSSYMIFTSRLIEKETEMMKGQVQQLSQSRTELEQRLSGVTASNSYDILSKAVEWTETYPIKTIHVLDELTGLLPKRGFINNLTYNESGALVLVAQFDESSQAAFYYKQLQNAPWIKEVQLSAVTTKEVANKEEDVTGKELPRYIGNYTFTLNDVEMKKLDMKRGEEE